MSALSLVAVFVALLIGLACGWLAWGRGNGVVAAERNDLRDKFGKAIADLNLALGESRQLAPLREDLATARREQEALRADTAAARREAADAVAEARGLAADRAARAEAADAQAERLADAQAAGAALRIDLDAARRETSAAKEELRGLRADREARDEAAEAQLRQLIEAKEALSAQFGEVGARLLDTAQRQFLERADQRFNQAGHASEEKIKAALAPVEATLKRYEEGVARVEEARRSEQNQLTGLIDAMRTGQEAVRGEAARLVNALRAAPKARGRWGEQQLRNVLETCGLSEHADFQTEVSVSGEEGRIRPDVIVRVPGRLSLIIDAKVSLNAYQDAYESVDDAERHRHLGAHAAAMKAHVNGLGSKAYWAEFEEAPDYVIMFVPGEHFLSAALEHDPTLWDFAFSKRVLLATPTNLIAIARTVAAVWRQEKVAKEAKAIAGLGKEMYDRLATASGLLKLVGGGLNSAVNNYNKFVSSFDSRIMVTGRKFRELNIETGPKDIEEVPQIEVRAKNAEDARLPAPAIDEAVG